MKKILHKNLVYLLSFIFLFPLLVILTNSFMTVTELQQIYTNMTLRLVPQLLSIEQYYILLIEKQTYLTQFWNSVLFSTIITSCHLMIAITLGYIFGKVNFRGHDFLFSLLLIVMVMPSQVTLVPNYILAHKLGILFTRSAIIYPGIFAPVGIFLMTQSIKYIPNELFEVFKLESSSIFQLFCITILPNCKAGFICVLILVFSDTWGMVEQPLILLNKASQYPLSVSLNTNLYSDVVFAGGVIYMVPILILYHYFQESIVDSLLHLKL